VGFVYEYLLSKVRILGAVDFFIDPKFIFRYTYYKVNPTSVAGGLYLFLTIADCSRWLVY